MRKNAKKIWLAVPIILFWSIWRERNRAVFDEGVPSTQKMKNSFVYTMWFWTSVLSDYQGSHIIEGLSMLSVV